MLVFFILFASTSSFEGMSTNSDCFDHEIPIFSCQMEVTQETPMSHVEKSMDDLAWIFFGSCCSEAQSSSLKAGGM